MSKVKKEVEQTTYPILSLRDLVVFPHMVVPLFVGREKSIRALDVVMQSNQTVVLLSQKDPTIDNPAMVMVMMNSIARPVHQPATGPSSARAGGYAPG